MSEVELAHVTQPEAGRRLSRPGTDSADSAHAPLQDLESEHHIARNARGCLCVRSHGWSEVEFREWIKQTGVWCIVTILARMVVFGAIKLVVTAPGGDSNILHMVNKRISTSFACQPEALLFMVLIGCPVAMNMCQLWVLVRICKSVSILIIWHG
eukprot:SAG25_NODE_1354_length_3222_cov_16.742235_3_plen_155_part_00